MNKKIIEYLTAVLESDYHKIESLLNDGLDVNVCCSRGNTAMRNASQDGNIEMLGYLLSKGADVNQRIYYHSPVDGRFEDGFTPVFYAHDATTLKYLVDSGADINAICKAGYSALMKCCHYSHNSIIPVIEMHLKCGADVSIRAPWGKQKGPVSAIDIAVSNKAFYENIYKKSPTKKIDECIQNAMHIINLLHKAAANRHIN